MRFTPTRVGISYNIPSAASILTVHPHACGDIRPVQIIYYRFTGSPPRVWGYHPLIGFVPIVQRFTPTRVGISSLAQRSSQVRQVHPHACGDIIAWYMVDYMKFGSPPRVWGYHIAGLPPSHPPRFTPTRVGISVVEAGKRRQPQVHPHACGDIVSLLLYHLWRCGSPPRVWGYPFGLIAEPL